jgi:hypothetical protein
MMALEAEREMSIQVDQKSVAALAMVYLQPPR